MLEPLALHKIQRRITGAIFASESLFSAGYIASITLLSLNAAQLSGSEALAGVPSTMALLVRAVAAIPIGWMMDKFGRRPIVTLGYLFGVIGLATGGFAVGLGSFALLCLSAGITGIASGASQQTRFIASEVWPAARRSSIIGFVVFAGTIGAIGGPLLVAPTSAWAAQLGLAANAGPYYAGAFITLLSMILAFSLLRPDPKRISASMEAAQEATRDAPPLVRPLGMIFRLAPVQLAVASMVVGQLVMTLVMVITPVYMNHLHHSTGEISLVFMAHTLGMFGFSAVTGWLIDKLGMRPMMAYGAAILIVSSIMAPWSTSVITLAVALFLLGLGWNFTFVAGSALLTDQLHASERGRVQGVNDTLVAVASGAGSLLTGTIFAASGMVGVGAVGLALTLFFLAMAAWLGLRQTGEPETVA